MSMVTARKQRPVLNHLNTLQLHQELRCPRLLSNPQLSQTLSRTPSSQLACHRLTQLLLLVFLRRLLWQVRKVLLNKDPKETHNSVSMEDIHRLVDKSNLHCPKSHTTHSANRLLQLKAHSKAIQTSNLSPRLNPSLELSPLHLISSPLTILPTHNSVTLITTITNSNMDCSKVPKVNKMALHPSNDLTVVTTVPRQRIPPSSPKALPSRPSPVTQLQERLKPAAIRLQTLLLKPSNQELLRALHHSNPVSNINLRLETTRMATPTTPAHTMLRT
jgi:hypothetical protein